jgi:hypothetical protein
MNHRLSLLALASLLLSTPAFAGPEVGPDGRKNEKVKIKKPAPEVNVAGFAPQTGPVGTIVSITGDGFTPDTKLILGGRSHKVSKVTPTELQFKVPAASGDGTIVLRHPGVARDILVGTFIAIADPAIHAFTPTSGIAGSKVELRGAGFEKGDQVYFGASLVLTLAAKDDRFVVTIPGGVASDFFYVQRPNGVRAKSSKKFTVVEPAPTIASISPASGPAGSSIRIAGTNFTAQDLVLYGKKTMQVQAITATTIDAIIPADAKADQFIIVRGKGGEASSLARFSLERPAVVSKVAPTFGLVGARVEIYGDNFRAGDRVTLNGVALRIEQLRATQISVTIPQQARSGVIVIERGNARVNAPGTFDVLFAPAVTTFSPAGGPIGSRVVINGRNFTSDAEVFWGVQKLKIVDRGGDTSLTVLVPKASTDQKLTVRTRAGSAESATAFQVHTYAIVSGLEPRAGFVGTRVAITGKQLDYINAVFLGNLALPIVEKGARRILVDIPTGASDGVLHVESFGVRQATSYSFTVWQGATIASLAPLSGPPGTQVTITGQNFSAQSKVSMGGKNLKIVSRSLPSQLVVAIPGEARGSAQLVVTEHDRQVTSAQTFTVLVPPTFVGFSPKAGKVGSQVTITGRDFSPQTEVWLGKQLAPIVSRSGDTIVVRVPDVKREDPLFRVRDGNGESAAAKRFTVLPSATITKISPPKAQAGAQIIVHGVGFEPGVRFWFRGAELLAKKITGGGTNAHLLVPNVAPGTDFIEVEDIGEHTRSSTTFEVVAAPQDEGNIDVRDHRKKKGGK